MQLNNAYTRAVEEFRNGFLIPHSKWLCEGEKICDHDLPPLFVTIVGFYSCKNREKKRIHWIGYYIAVYRTNKYRDFSVVNNKNSSNQTDDIGDFRRFKQT